MLGPFFRFKTLSLPYVLIKTMNSEKSEEEWSVFKTQRERKNGYFLLSTLWRRLQLWIVSKFFFVLCRCFTNTLYLLSETEQKLWKLCVFVAISFYILSLVALLNHIGRWRSEKGTFPRLEISQGRVEGRDFTSKGTQKVVKRAYHNISNATPNGWFIQVFKGYSSSFEWIVCRRRVGLMISALISGSSGLGSSPGRGHFVVYLGKTLYSHSASLYPGV